jgi:phytoene dehydrogenase-like protein
MTPASSYDVVLVGTELAPLLAGALLAKRGFRVLLVAQDELPPTYPAVDGLELPREPFNFLPASSPMAKRMLRELALHQLFRRRATQIDPAFQICLPQHRFELALEPEILEREIEREFPEVKRPVEDLLRTTDRDDALLDRVIERELTWPPTSFLERREFARASAHQPYGKQGTAIDPLAEFPEQHPFRLAVELPARFADGMDPDYPSGLRLARLFHAWRRGGAVLEQNYASLRGMLLDSIRTHSGDVREPEKVDAILVRRGTACGVRIAASGEEIGAGWVLVGAPLAAMMRLVPDRAPFEELFERIGEPVVRYYRYTLNLLVAPGGVPEGMSRDVFFVRDPDRPLSEANALHVQVDPPDARGRRLLCAEALLPRRGIEDIPEYAETMRERVIASLGELVPFLGDHVELADSPHDGRPIQDFAAGANLPPPEPWARGPHTMRRVYGFPVTTALGVCALPVRTPIKRLLIANEQIVPGLGLEGLFLAAWSAARVVSKSDRKMDWMRRGRWGKLEM